MQATFLRPNDPSHKSNHDCSRYNLSLCEQRYIVWKKQINHIEYKNWILIWIEISSFFIQISVISITPTKIEYGMANETAYCDKLKYNIYRRRPKHCMSYHAEETEIKLCGRASFGASCLSPLLLILCVLIRYVFLSPSISSWSLGYRYEF